MRRRRRRGALLFLEIGESQRSALSITECMQPRIISLGNTAGSPPPPPSARPLPCDVASYDPGFGSSPEALCDSFLSFFVPLCVPSLEGVAEVIRWSVLVGPQQAGEKWTPPH